MNLKNKNIISVARKTSIIFLLLTILALALFGNQIPVFAVPQGAKITLNQTENASVRPVDSHTAAGGSFTTLVLNVTSQTSKWKAYVGNVTGKITLDNSYNYTIYDWAITIVQGEVYVSRNDSVSFSSLACANDGNISAEETTLNINSSTDDSISNTFDQQVHKSFVIGGTGTISNSSCYAIATYVNDSAQPADESATFQEILLSDGLNLVFTTLLENNEPGFDVGTYDFQFIVPDDPGDTSITYYFWAELG
ncbi:hypothetical protein AYK26_03935 [Euryarchaeota archaeon SM23-78]|nr:MAG: hypothetical protein AYK26_03935 [Euryarchaeota archaeon SM23-78]MBW3001452.1 hypothetical protein [Candidatus Woesearchaeota archaeon]